MEFEIDDDPQGEGDRCEADRTGGLGENRPLHGRDGPLRKHMPQRLRRRRHLPPDAHAGLSA